MAKKPLRADKVGAHNTQYLKNRTKLMKVTEHCALCGKELNYNIKYPHPLAPVADHIIPVSKGGHPSSIDNLQILHSSCNRNKSDKLFINEGADNSEKSNQPAVNMNRNLPQSMDWTKYRSDD